MKLNDQQLINIVLASFEAERTGDIEGGIKLIHKDFTVTDMWIKGETLFPSLSGDVARKLMKKAFPMKGRKFEFNLIVSDENQQTVVVEFIESYPDPITRKIFRTPQIAICYVRDGLIWKTRHYCDPKVTFADISQQDIDRALSLIKDN